MKKRSGLYPRVQVDAAVSGVVSEAGAVVLVETARAIGLDREMSTALQGRRRPCARHDPGKVVLDLAAAITVGGDCLADIAVLRREPRVFGSVASDPTVSGPSPPWPQMLHELWPRSEQPARQPAPELGGWPVSTPPTTTATSFSRW